jgi:hypothetical protein
MISEERLEKALRLLSTTDEQAAELKIEMLRREYVVDTVRKRMFLVAEGTSVEQRKAVAETSAEVQESIGIYLDATSAFEKLKAKRATEELIVEVWRSLNANRRQGNV